MNCRSLLFCFLAILLHASGVAIGRTAPRVAWAGARAEDVRVPFRMPGGGRLVVRVYDFPGFHRDLGERLYYVKSDKVTEVSNLQALKRLVEISKPEDALAFVRLRTSPRTYLGFTVHSRIKEAEIIAREDLDEECVYGDTSFLDELRKKPSGYFGIIDRASARHLAIAPAAVTTDRTGYLITRTVLIEKHFTIRGSSEFAMETLVEHVDRSGTHKVIKRKSRPVPRGIRWSFPRLR